NTIAVEILDRVGIERAVEFARTIGIDTPLTPNYTLALGTSESTPLVMANAYATFAAGGVLDAPVFIERIEDRDGDIVFEAERDPQRVISKESAFLITSMMRSVATEGTAASKLKDWEHPAVG